jgi:uncharacterized zinc-type alcohol dehydrogenase-like protein
LQLLWCRGNYVKPFAIERADAKKLGAHYFALTSDPEVMKSLAGEFDVILNTVSADDYNEYLKLLNTNGTMIVV